ncbi:MAG: transposase [Carnobacterium maltaromaticum]|uniref:transposase n=1 Tax=Carnobacterium maltaromaticum TaxID=2751 RepID=UPI0039908068
MLYKRKAFRRENNRIYKQRKVDFEPVFGFLKAYLGFTRFHVRGQEQVTNEIGLALMAVNLRKLAVRWGKAPRKREFCPSLFICWRDY